MEFAVNHLSVTFGAVTALDDVTLALPFGSQVLLWGPAGGGKTSLLKVLAGLWRPTRGQCLWAGVDPSTLPLEGKRKLQADLGFIFQTDALFDSLSVLENVRLPLVKRGVGAEEATERALAALKQVGLADAADRAPERLSGGMKKRAGVARAIVARPTVLLADDPFAGLDPKTEGAIAALLQEVSAGRTLIAALPDPVASLPLKTRYRLREGRLEATPC
jgi:phospholipid/cholesterol/gamma-HCH transport system ATP-binding protein